MSHGKVTDTSIFTCPDTTNTEFSLAFEDIGDLIVGHNKENANVPQNPEATNLTIAEIVKKEYALRHIFSSDVAYAHRHGDIRIHDLGMVDRPYCSGQSPAYIAKFGLSMPDSLSIAKPAKHAVVLIEQIIKMSASLQGVFAGAIGWDAINMYLAPYLVGLSDTEIKQLAQVLVYEFSQQAVARGGQAVFSDINLYWEIPKHFRDTEAILPGGVTDGTTYGDYADESKRFFRALMEVYTEGDAIGRPFFFPKPDVHITEAFFEEPDCDEALDLLCRVTSKMGNPYFIFDRGDSVKLSECCFDGDTEVLVHDSTGIMKIPISEVRMVNNLKVFHNGTWAGAKRVVLPRNGKDMYRIRTVNGKEFVVTEDHRFPTLNGDTEAKDLSEDDYLMFSTRALHGEGGTFAMGVLIGAYLGDGSRGTNTTIFSMNPKKVEKLKPIIIRGMEDMGVEANIFVDKNGTSEGLRIHSKKLMEIIEDYVVVGTASNKGLRHNVFALSEQFRRGVIFGLYATDGGNSRRIYTTSKRLTEDMETLFTTLGMQCRIDVSDRREEGCVIHGKEYNRNHVLYTIRWYDPKNHRRKEGVYKQINNSMYFKIESVEKIPDYDKDTVYCFEMEYEDEPYFTLPCGVITHNCRLNFELTKDDLKECATPWLMRSTALQNITINLPRLAYRSKDMDSFYEHLSETIDLCVKAHEQKRAFIEDVIARDNSPLELLKMNLDGHPYLRMEKTNHLIGMLGLNEAVLAMCGSDLSTQHGYEVGFDIIERMSELIDEAKLATGIKFVLEQTPAESTAYSLAQLDLKHYPESINFVRGTDGSYYYTNSTQLPIDADISAIERIRKEGNMHPLITAGAITHIWLGEHMPNPESLASLIKKVFYKSSNVQVAFSPEFTTCVSCGTTTRGLTDTCSRCGSADVEGITRVTGYFSKIHKWNNGKVAELKDRHRQNI